MTSQCCLSTIQDHLVNWGRGPVVVDLSQSNCIENCHMQKEQFNHNLPKAMATNETPLCWYKDINQMPQSIQHTFRNRNNHLTLQHVTSLAFMS